MPLLEEIGYDENKHNAMVAAARGCGITNVIRNLVQDYLLVYADQLKKAADINGGLCDAFASDVIALVSGAKLAWGDEIDDTMPGADSHAIVVFEGRFYDAECPEGADSVNDIPFFRACREIYEESLVQIARKEANREARDR